jgi:hypothetical protein
MGPAPAFSGSLLNATSIRHPRVQLPLSGDSLTIFDMVRKLLMGAGVLLLILNAGVYFCPAPDADQLVRTASVILGLGVVLLASKISDHALAPIPAAIPTTPPPPPLVEPALPQPPPPRAEAEVVAFLALLQEQGRLVDFVREDVSSASDQQLGTAARVVHAGCRKVLEEYFEIDPLHTANEGDTVVLETGYDAAAHRLLGAVPEKPPYTGKLLHPGWVTRSVKLPRVTGTTAQRPWPVLAPAEVNLSGK